MPCRISWGWPVHRGVRDEGCPGELRAQAKGGHSVQSVPEPDACHGGCENVGTEEAGKRRGSPWRRQAIEAGFCQKITDKRTKGFML